METLKMNEKKRSQRRVFLFAWTLVQQKNRTISQALKIAWVAYRDRDVLHLYLTFNQITKAKRPEYASATSYPLFD